MTRASDTAPQEHDHESPWDNWDNPVAVFGGVYSNHLALEAAIEDARRRGAARLYCLGDLGAFGPHPEKVFPLLIENDVRVVRGNYDDSIGRGLADCQCGYTDSRDNHFAALSYAYTFAKTPARWRPWLRDLPPERWLDFAGRRALMCHGSPRKMNEFLWESACSTHFLERLADERGADIVLVTHTGLKWHRELPGGKHFVNVGVIGRPENDGRSHVWYTLINFDERGTPVFQFVPIEYDHERLADEMRREGLPHEFIVTIQTGWWTTCLEILPSKERRRGRF